MPLPDDSGSNTCTRPIDHHGSEQQVPKRHLQKPKEHNYRGIRSWPPLILERVHKTGQSPLFFEHVHWTVSHRCPACALLSSAGDKNC